MGAGLQYPKVAGEHVQGLPRLLLWVLNFLLSVWGRIANVPLGTCSVYHWVPLQEPARAQVHVPLHVHLQWLWCYLDWSSIMEEGSHRRMYHPAPWISIFQACFVNLSGPIKGSTGDRVQRTLGLSCYTVLLVLPVCSWISQSSEEGMATSWLREGLEYINTLSKRSL